MDIATQIAPENHRQLRLPPKVSRKIQCAALVEFDSFAALQHFRYKVRAKVVISTHERNSQKSEENAEFSIAVGTLIRCKLHQNFLDGTILFLGY